MRRSRIILLLLILAAVFVPIGVHWYFQPVRVEELNNQRWCMCDDRQVAFKNGSITLLSSPHPENENVGSVIGTYKIKDGTLHISGIMTKPAGDFPPVCMHGEAGFSKTKITFIKKNRAALLPAVAAKLESVDLTRAPQPQKPDPAATKDEIDIDPIGVDPTGFNTLLLSIIEETDAVEVLPSLLQLEEKYHAMLIAAQKDPKAPLPQTDGDGAGIGPGNQACARLLTIRVGANTASLTA